MGNPLQFVDPFGKVRVAPSAVSKVILQTESPPASPDATDVVALCGFAGGTADTWKAFKRLADAEAYHDPLGSAIGVVEDPGCRYMKRMFNPSPRSDTQGANTIHTLRVGDPIGSSAHLMSEQDGDGVTLASIDDGVQTNQLQAKFATPTNATVAAAGGVKFQVRLYPNTQNEQERTIDNLGLPFFIRGDEAAAVGTIDAQVTLGSAHSMLHDAHDAVNQTSERDAVDLVTGQDLANALQTDYNAHLAQVGVHWIDDAANTSIAAPAINLGTLITLVNEIKEKFNLHRANTGGDYHKIAGVAAADPYREVTAADATDLATALALANEIKHHFNSHRLGYSTNEVNALTVTLNTPNAGYPGSATFDFSESQNSTVAKLVDSINAVTGLNATLFGGIDPSFPTKYLDVWDAVEDVKSDSAWVAVTSLAQYPVWAIRQYAGDVVDPTIVPGWFGYRGGNDGYNTCTYESFAGGSNDAGIAAADFTDALTAVTNNTSLSGGHIFLGLDCLANSDNEAAVRIGVKSWLAEEREDRGRIWRVFVPKLTSVSMGGASLGAVSPTLASYEYVPTDAEVSSILDDVVTANSQYMGYEWQRMIDYDNTGNLVVYGALDMCAAKTGMSAGTRKTRPLSGLALNGYTLLDRPTDIQIADLLQGGCNVQALKNRVIKCVMCVTSRLSEKRMERMWSEVNAGVYLENRVRTAIERLVPKWGGLELVTRAEDAVRNILSAEAEGVVPEDGVALLSPGTDADGNALPPFDGIAATLLAGVIEISWNAYIAGEVDHVFATGLINYQRFGVSVTI